MKSKILFINIILVVLFMNLTLAAWYNPFTWFGDKYDTVRTEGWYLDYSSENYEFFAYDKNKHKTTLCIIDKDAENKKDLEDKELYTANNKEGKGKRKEPKIKAQKILKKDSGFSQDKYGYCYTVKDKEKHVKFGKHSTVVQWTSEQVLLKDSENNTILEGSLITDDFTYKNGKPHKDLGLGYQLTHTIKLKSYDDLTNVLNDVQLIDMNTGEEIDKEFDVKLRYTQNVEVNTTDENCTTVYNETTENETEQCETYVNGSYITTEYAYMDLGQFNNSLNMTDGSEHYVAFFMDIEQGDYFDIVPSIAGVKFDFWASVSGDLSTDLVCYYEFQETTGDVIDSHGTHNGTNHGATRGVTGKIEDAFSYDGVNDYVDVPYSSEWNIRYEDLMTWSVWVKINEYPGDTQHIFRDLYNIDKDGTQLSTNGSGYLFTRFRDGTKQYYYTANGTNIDKFELDQWYHIAITFDRSATNFSIFINGTYKYTIPPAPGDGLYNRNNPMHIGSDPGPYYFLKGKIDEFATWTRKLSSSEIDLLYNSGSGIPYVSPTDIAPTVVLDSPANETSYNANSQSVDFKCKGQDDINLVNITHYLWNMSDGSLISTTANTDGQNDTLETFTKTVYGGTNYSWNCLAYDNSSQSSFADNNRTVFVYSIPDASPNVSIGANNPPDGTQYLVNQTLTFNASNIYDDNKVDNVSLVINTVVQNTTLNPPNNSNQQWTNSFTDGDYDWYFIVYDNASQSLSTDVQNFAIDTLDALVNITAPENGTIITEYNESFYLNWTAEDVNLDSCYYGNTIHELQYNDSLKLGPGTYTGWIYITDKDTQEINLIYERALADTFPYIRIYQDANTKGGSYTQYDSLDLSGNLSLTTLNENGWHYFIMENDYWFWGSQRDYAEMFKTTSPVNYAINDNSVVCSSNTTTVNYPTTNPDQVIYYFFANDTFGRSATDNVTVVKSTESPNITINSPDDVETNKTYTINISTEGGDVNETIYNYNGTNYTYSSPVSVEGSEGTNTLEVWVEDGLDNDAYENISFEIYTINVTLIQPEDEELLFINDVTFNSSANLTSEAYIKNATFYDNSSGSWEVKHIMPDSYYYILIYADEVTGETSDVNLTEIKDGVYMVRGTNGSYEVDRALVMKWLFYDSRATSTYMTNVSEVVSSDPRDENKKGFYGSFWYNSADDKEGYYNATITGSGLRESFWSSISTATFGEGETYYPGSRKIINVYETSEGHIGTDRSTDEYDYPQNLSLWCRIYGYVGTCTSKAIILSEGNLTWTHTGSTGSSGDFGISNTDYYNDHGFPPFNFGMLTDTYSAGESIMWNVQYCDSDGDCRMADDNYTFYIDNDEPTTELNYPNGTLDVGSVGDDLEFNFTVTDDNLDSVWYDYNGTNISIDSPVSGVNILENITLTESKNITIYANDTAGNLDIAPFDWDYEIFETARTYNTTTYETSTETFTIEFDSSTSMSNVNLIYGDVNNYSMNIQSVGVWTKEIDIPTSYIGEHEIRFEYVYDGGTTLSDYITNQTVKDIFFNFSNASMTESINVTITDEDTEEYINDTTLSFIIEYWAGDGTYKIEQYSSAVADGDFEIGWIPTDLENLKVDIHFWYEAPGYQIRNYYNEFNLTNDTALHIPLYMLDLASGIITRYQVTKSLSGDYIEGVKVSSYKQVVPEILTEVSLTDATGIATMYQDVDYYYNMIFEKEGCDTIETMIRPTSTEAYPIQMDCEDDEPQNTTTDPWYNPTEENETFYYISPTTSVIYKGMNTFTANITDEACLLENIYFYIMNSTDSILNETTSPNSCTANMNLTYNVTNETEIRLRLIYNTEGENYTIKRTYEVIGDTIGDGIDNLWDTINNIPDEDFEQYGLDSKTRVFLSIVVLFIILTFLSQVEGFKSEGIATLLVIPMYIWIISFFGWLALDISSFDFINKYSLAILITLFTGGVVALKSHN